MSAALLALVLGLSPVEQAQRAQLDALRAEIAAQVQLQAFDLVDELVFGWIRDPVFTTDTPVLLAEVSVPVGLGTGLKAVVENHLTGLLIKNPKAKMIISYCPQCTAILVHSGQKGTIVSRGVDAPEALQKAGGLAGARHAIFLDFEAEGSSLVMRARVTSIEPSLPIVYARTLTSSSASPALLRSGDTLKSAADAHAEYLEALNGQGVITVPMRMTLRTYAKPDSGAPVAAAPFIWLTAGVEVGLTQARVWTAGFSLGYTWSPITHNGWLAQARISRLISGLSRSLTQPDLYFFTGASAITISGLDANVFRNETPEPSDILADDGEDARATFAAWQLGLELRVKNRIGASIFFEAMPAFDSEKARGIGNFIDLGFTEVQTFGTEVSFCF